MKFNFNYENKEYRIECLDCKSFFMKARGLMFRKASKPLLFRFNTLGIHKIHSYFCQPFHAIWFNHGDVVGDTIIQKKGVVAFPNSPADTLLELPLDWRVG